MSQGQVTLTQYSDNIAYARFWDASAGGGAGAFTDNDAEAVSIGGIPFALWAEPNDALYIGKSSTFAYVGFRVGTAGVGLGTFTVEYWDGDSWETLTVLHNSTTGFTTSGYFAWAIPGDWAAYTNGGLTPSAYWIRVYQNATPGTVPTAEHLMRNVTLDPPLHVEGPERTIDTTYRDINGTLRKVDITSRVPDHYVVNISQMALSMGNLQMLIDWKYYDIRIFIEDEAVTTPITLTSDAYYRTLQGMLAQVPTAMYSPGKMGLDLGAYYPLVFKIDTVVTQSSTLGLPLT